MSTAYWYDSGVLSVAMTAGDQIGFYVQTAGVGCNAGSGPVFTMIYQ
jgi:low affinity Fe/Cu permease